MAEEYNYQPDFPSYAPPPETPKRNRTLLIAVIVLLVLCCCCVAFALVMYFFLGDLITDELGITYFLSPLAALL